MLELENPKISWFSLAPDEINYGYITFSFINIGFEHSCFSRKQSYEMDVVIKIADEKLIWIIKS